VLAGYVASLIRQGDARQAIVRFANMVLASTITGDNEVVTARYQRKSASDRARALGKDVEKLSDAAPRCGRDHYNLAKIVPYRSRV